VSKENKQQYSVFWIFFVVFILGSTVFAITSVLARNSPKEEALLATPSQEEVRFFSSTITPVSTSTPAAAPATPTAFVTPTETPNPLLFAVFLADQRILNDCGFLNDWEIVDSVPVGWSVIEIWSGDCPFFGVYEKPNSNGFAFYKSLEGSVEQIPVYIKKRMVEMAGGPDEMPVRLVDLLVVDSSFNQRECKFPLTIADVSFGWPTHWKDFEIMELVATDGCYFYVVVEEGGGMGHAFYLLEGETAPVAYYDIYYLPEHLDGTGVTFYKP
jgi:hypothetical protein